VIGSSPSSVAITRSVAPSPSMSPASMSKRMSVTMSSTGGVQHHSPGSCTPSADATTGPPEEDDVASASGGGRSGAAAPAVSSSVVAPGCDATASVVDSLELPTAELLDPWIASASTGSPAQPTAATSIPATAQTRVETPTIFAA
jgi:hypothetical protein